MGKILRKKNNPKKDNHVIILSTERIGLSEEHLAGNNTIGEDLEWTEFNHSKCQTEDMSGKYCPSHGTAKIFIGVYF